MAHDASVCGIAANALSVSGNQNECSMASARSNSFCAAGLHEVLNSTLPSFSLFASSSCPYTPDTGKNNADATSAAMMFGFMVSSLTGEESTPLEEKGGNRGRNV